MPQKVYFKPTWMECTVADKKLQRFTDLNLNCSVNYVESMGKEMKANRGTKDRKRFGESSIYWKEPPRHDKLSRVVRKDFPCSISHNLNHMNKKERKKSPSVNKSTLSLHIAAYENSIEDGNNSDVEEKKQQKIVKTSENGKGILKVPPGFFISFPPGLTFEIPRQQEEGALTKNTPEISQFKASQKLLNPNKSNKRHASPPLVQKLITGYGHSSGSRIP
uniref:Uncharacterized protein n=1 Tax=Panagrolaimus sp. ES5 TaxID=591445 RepID=A0AC34F694_9BILA